MQRFVQTIRMAVVLGLLLGGLPLRSYGQVAGGGLGAFGGGGRGLIHITARVVCSACNLDEAHQMLPNDAVFYQLQHQQGSAVIQVERVNDIAGFRSFAWPTTLQVRSQGSLFRTLAAEGNRTREVELIGFLSGVRTLNMYEVRISGVTVRGGV
jgi:hypothetical protein